jgi:drug/metabolite transporter (DMT)-like permease
MSSTRVKAYLLLILVTIIWGFAGPVIKYTLPTYPPFIFLTYRFLISTLILFPIVLVLKPKWPNNKKEFLILTAIGLLGSSINLGLLFYGYNYTNVLDATILSNTAPIFVVAAAALFLREHVTKKEKVGILITFIGTLTILLEPTVYNGVSSSQRIIGNLLIIAANFAWVAYIILSKYALKHKFDTLFMTFYMFFLGFITILPFSIIQSGSVSNLLISLSAAPLKNHLGVWYMAVLSGNLAYFLYQKGQKSIEASEATLFSYLTPLFAAPLAVFWLKEKITLPFILGSIIIVVGIVISEYKKSGQKSNPKNSNLI